MDSIESILNWTLLPIVSWAGLWFSVRILPQPFDKYFDWSFNQDNPLWVRVAVGYILGCVLVYAYGTFLTIA